MANQKDTIFNSLDQEYNCLRNLSEMLSSFPGKLTKAQRDKLVEMKVELIMAGTYNASATTSVHYANISEAPND